jgi:hypothetical protein
MGVNNRLFDFSEIRRRSCLQPKKKLQKNFGTREKQLIDSKILWRVVNGFVSVIFYIY